MVLTRNQIKTINEIISKYQPRKSQQSQLFSSIKITPTKLYNFTENNALQDVIDIFFDTPLSNFSKFIINQGKQFENLVIDYIIKKFPKKMIDLTKYDFQNRESITKTALLKKHVKILYQPVLQDNGNCLFGIPDLIVKGNFINTLFASIRAGDERELRGSSIPARSLIAGSCAGIRQLPRFDSDALYIIDIKYRQLQQSMSSGKLIGVPKYIQLQLFIYSKLLSKITDKKIYTMILGKGLDNSTQNCFETLSFLNCNENICCNCDDKQQLQLQELLDNGTEWITRLHTLTVEPYDLFDPSNYSNGILPFPNMKINDNPIKNEIAYHIGELTLHRDYSNNLRTQIQSNCGGILKRIDTNTKPPIVNIDVLRNCLLKAGLVEKENFKHCLFIDCESKKNYSFNNFPIIQDSETFAFAGIKKFGGEYDIIYSLNDLNVSEKTKFIYWFAEDKILENYDNDKIDLYKIFVESEIILPGCMSFKLKDVVKYLHSFGFISTNYSNCKCKNGLDAMLVLSGVKIEDLTVSDVIEYNKIDVIVLEEILLFLYSLCF